MFDYFRTKLEALLDSVLEPFWKWVMTASPKVRIVILLIFGGTGGAVAYPDVPQALYSRADAITRAGLAGRQTIPWPHDLTERTRGTAKRLSQTVRADLLKLTSGATTPWSTAQAASASAGMESVPLNKETIAAFIRSNAVPGCACWTEMLGKPSDPQGLFISGWVMTAFAAMGVPANSQEIRYALDAQTADGWWPIFHGANQAEYASTYSTAWVLIGLLHQKNKGYLDQQDAPDVDNAITKATGWLLSQRTKGGRWKPYPRLNSSSESDSISGLVIHALHLAVPDQMSAIDKAWIDRLPIKPPSTSEGENYYVELEGTQPRAIDHFVQIKAPWMLIATIDAYPSGDILQRAKALHWLEATLNQESMAMADSDESNWWRAELLYALRYVLKDIEHSRSRSKTPAVARFPFVPAAA